jgi:hypothetical protein
MFTSGADAWIVAAGVLAVTGVPVGTTASGIGTGGIANEQLIIAPALTSGGMALDSTPRHARFQTRLRPGARG